LGMLNMLYSFNNNIRVNKVNITSTKLLKFLLFLLSAKTSKIFVIYYTTLENEILVRIII